ncbi:MAG TPA: SDR family NAD(P)-dependent oxidoreductase, partial [Caulobacteraceae bacterium]|nr:SDR family NAD(P)-dependent oxidoreductase [Caulobacteraceae bacterium]
MDLGLAGKTALVLGGGGGLGRAIAKSLAREGARVAVADINAAAVEATLAALSETGAVTLGLVWDLADLAQIEDHVARVEAELGHIDILV